MYKIDKYKLLSYNRKAKFNYTIISNVEAGIALKGSEVKSIRLNKSISISEAYIFEKNKEFFIKNMYIPRYKMSSALFNHNPERDIKLLLNKNQINKLIGQIKEKGLTIIPIEIYFNTKGLIKLNISLVKGKNKFDKRESIKDRDYKRRLSKLDKE